MICSHLMPKNLQKDCFQINRGYIMDFVLASKNVKKLNELRRILEPLGINVLGEGERGIKFPEVEENGKTFEENSMIKAKSACISCNLPAIADDSGLCVDALNGEPGIYSARFAGEGHNDDDNNSKLLELMKNVPDEDRTARFVSVVSCCFPDGRHFSVRGECEGYIARSLEGDGGFGYDPLFLVNGVSFGNLTAEQKDALSHRGKALKLFAEKIKEYI